MCPSNCEARSSGLTATVAGSGSSSSVMGVAPSPDQPSRLPQMFRLHHSASDTNDKNRVKSRLKKFITRRPSLKTLQEKGLIKGLDVDGIYRVSGNLATIQKLRFIVNQEEKLNLDDSQWEDIHVVTGALKIKFFVSPQNRFPKP
ncbi:Rho GTPase-activating protein 15 [Myotis davidii]|uniref:Rho GTPase-activating protein 15 n=1 Tax=Myotis davidii TaxID=225400 RepID=L5LKR7_MYODS|nr:Rho GTPase-activating protein 15 [Myotis davidii]